ncbi:MAG: pyruvoyl-dependent arginine decarboxylase, partial [Candidatus Njordarchaeota archaeon]
MSLITAPKKVYIAAASAEGSSHINAFDACLVKVGLPQVSLVKVTSILPHNVDITEKAPILPDGSNVPAIYAYSSSDSPGETVSAAVALALTNGPTLVAEHAAASITREK